MKITGRDGLELKNKLHAVLQQYQAKFYMNMGDAHIYYSRPIQQYLMARSKGKYLEVTFHRECPCADL